MAMDWYQYKNYIVLGLFQMASMTADSIWSNLGNSQF